MRIVLITTLLLSFFKVDALEYKVSTVKSIINTVETVTTQRDNSYFREGPASFFNLIAILPAGASLTVIERDRNWVKVKDDQNREGWVAGNCFKSTGNAEQGTSLARRLAQSSVSVNPQASRAGIAAAVKGFAGRYSSAQPGDIDAVMAHTQKSFSINDIRAFKAIVDNAGGNHRETMTLRSIHKTVPGYNLGLRELQIGAGIATKLVAIHGLVEDDRLHQYVNMVAAHIARQSEIYDWNFKVFVLNDDQLNAFSAPGGYIFISKGLIGECRDEAELAGILAHEMAHVIFRHGLEEMGERVTQISASDAFDELNAEVGMEEGEGELWQQAEDSYERIVHRRTSEYEIAADKSGMILAATAGYDPIGLVRVSQRLMLLQETDVDMFDPNYVHIEDAKKRAASTADFADKNYLRTGRGGCARTPRFTQIAAQY